MNDKETHVLINTEQHCVKSSLQWKWADGKQACEVLGCKTENAIWHWKLQPSERNYTWMKAVPQIWKSSAFNFLWFWGYLRGCCSLLKSPRGKHYSGAQPTFHTGKHTTHQPRSHPFTTERFPIPRRRMAPFISSQSSISVQQKVWDIILEYDVIRADPEVYALTTLSFLPFETEIYDRRQRKRWRSQGWWNALRKHRAGTKGYVLLTALCLKGDQVRKAAQLPLVHKLIPFLDFSLWKHEMPQQWRFH